MARTPTGNVTNTRNARPAAAAATSTPVRNTSIPPRPQAAGGTKTISRDVIAKRAYEISQSPQRGSDMDNWLRAERELMGR